MTKVRTDKTLIEKFLTRGVDKVYPTAQALAEKLYKGEKIRAYQGFDPSGPYLHIGHAMGIRALRILQELGHEVIFLIGDYTAKVGDPDPAKQGTRTILSDEKIAENMDGWKSQAAQLIDFNDKENPVLFKQNSEWLSKLTLADLIHLMSNATVQQMMERDMFQRRLKEENPIQLQEFLYPLMQGYDGVAMNVDLEMGGTDQTFNMLMGRELSRRYNNKEKFVRTNELMEAPDARTMSKTKGNGINLADSPENMYGKAMSYPDELITKGLRLLTDVSLEDIVDIEGQMRAGANPMLFKKLMAFEIVKIIRGEAGAREAQNYFEKTVQNKEVSELDAVQIPLSELAENLNLQDFLKRACELGSDDVSGAQIRRLIEQGGVEVNGVKTTSNELTKLKAGDLIKFGKRRYFRII